MLPAFWGLWGHLWDLMKILIYRHFFDIYADVRIDCEIFRIILWFIICQYLLDWTLLALFLCCVSIFCYVTSGKIIQYYGYPTYFSDIRNCFWISRKTAKGSRKIFRYCFLPPHLNHITLWWRRTEVEQHGPVRNGHNNTPVVSPA